MKQQWHASSLNQGPKAHLACKCCPYLPLLVLPHPPPLLAVVLYASADVKFRNGKCASQQHHMGCPAPQTVHHIGVLQWQQSYALHHPFP
jgi:hypothetical protein